MIYFGDTKIGKLYLGSTPIGKAYFGSNLVYSSGSGPGPQPTGIPYIRNSNLTEYIDTGITPDNNTRVIVWARNFNPHCGVLFGSRVALGNKAFGIGAYGSLGIGQIRVDYNTGSVYADDQYTNMSGYHKYELDGNVFKIDDVAVATATTATFSNNYNIYILAMNTSNSAGRNMTPTDICAAQIYKSGVLVRDYVAVNSPSVGLYDSVSNTLFTNAGQGSFTFGRFEPEAYTQLEYVSCTNSQYIDTGVYGRKDLIVVVKFKILGTSLGYPDLFGTRRENQSGTWFMVEFGSTSYVNRYARFFIDTNTIYAMYSSTSPRLTDQVLSFVKDDTTVRLVKNNANFGTAKTFSPSESFVSTSPDTLLLGTIRDNGNAGGTPFNGYIYYACFGSERNFVPAKVNNVVGLYDTYNDVFYPSSTETPFVAGPEV